MIKHVTTNVKKEEHLKKEEERKHKKVERVDLSKMITTHDLEMKKRKQQEDALSNIIETRNEELNDYNKALNKNEKEQKEK